MLVLVQDLVFTMLGSLAPIMGLLQEMQLRERTQLLIMWTSRGSSWTLGHHGSFGPLDLLGEPLDS